MCDWTALSDLTALCLYPSHLCFEKCVYDTDIEIATHITQSSPVQSMKNTCPSIMNSLRPLLNFDVFVRSIWSSIYVIHHSM